MQEINDSNYLEKLFTDEVKGTLNKTSGGDSGGSYGWTTKNKHLVEEVIKSAPEEIMVGIISARDFANRSGVSLYIQDARLLFVPEDIDEGNPARYVGNATGVLYHHEGQAAVLIAGSVMVHVDVNFDITAMWFNGYYDTGDGVDAYIEGQIDRDEYEFGILSYKGKPVEIPIVKFTIDGKTYEAYSGMSWEDWVNSEYNQDGFHLGTDNLVYDANDYTIMALPIICYVGYTEPVVPEESGYTGYVTAVKVDINSGEYTLFSKPGMTWGEWVASEYNQDGWYIDNNYVYNPEKACLYDNFAVISTDVIDPNHNYTFD